MADTLQFGPEWLRTLSHGSSGHASSQGLAPLSVRGTTKAKSIQYSRDNILSFYNASVSSEVPEGIRVLPEIMSDRRLQPMAWIPQSNDELHLLTLSAKGSASGIRIDLEPSVRHRAKSNWNESANFREAEEPVSRSKHSREEFRDESSTSKTFESVRGRNVKEGTSSRPPEFSRSMSSDNWREAKKRESESDIVLTSSWRSRAEHARTTTVRNWREPSDRESDSRTARLHRGDSLHQDRGEHSRRKTFDRNYGSDDDDSELPEWSTEGVEDVGTFDATGVFIPMGDIKDSEDWNPELDECEDGSNERVMSPENVDAEDEEVNQHEQIEQIVSDHNILKPSDEESLSVSDPVSCRERQSDNEETAAEPPIVNNSSDSVVTSDESCVPLSDVVSGAVVSEPDIDFIRLGVVPENLVASLFDDDSAISGGGDQKHTGEPKKGFVAGNDADANNWFYQDPQGIIQGPFRPNEMCEWFNAGYFSQNLLVKHGCDVGFIQLGDLIKKVGQDPFSERSFAALTRSAAPTTAAEVRATTVMPVDTAAQAAALQSADQTRLLQMLMNQQQESLRQQQENLRQQQAVPQQQQALLQLLLQSQASASQAPHAGNVQSQQQSGFIRPRAIKSQQSVQSESRDVGKMDQVAKFNELLSQQSNVSDPMSALTADQKALLQLILRQQAMYSAPQPSQLGSNRPIQSNSSSFHRSVSQPVGMDMSGLSTAGWNVGGAGKSSVVAGNNLGGIGNNFGPSVSGAQPSTMWRGASGVPLNNEPGTGWKSDFPVRMTVEELEALQFIAAEKARQDHQKRQAAAAAADELEVKEQLKAVLLQRRQQQVSAERERQQIEERRLVAAATAVADRSAEFDMRERQRQEELRRRQEKADELRRQQQIELLRTLPLASDSQSFQLALSAVNGYDQRRDFGQSSHDASSVHSISTHAGNNYWLQKDVEATKTAVNNMSQWQHNPQLAALGGNFASDGRQPLTVNTHVKMASESSSWEDLVGGMSNKGASGNALSCSTQMLSMATNQSLAAGAQAVGAKSLKDEGLQKLVQVAAYKEEFARWCDATVKSFHANINVPVFLRHLNEVETVPEVAQYVRTYLGNSQETLNFIQQYWEKRECWRQQNKMIQEIVFQCMKSGKW